MATKASHFTIHPALGGLDISSDPSILDANFLTAANNVEYLEGGQRKKRGGLSVYSSGATSTGTNTFLPGPLRALGDHWSYGASLTATQHIIGVSSLSIYNSTGDGKWTAITTASSFGSSGSSKTTITLAGDYAVINDAEGSTPPVAWDQTTLHQFTSSGGSLSVFTGATYHLNRLVTVGHSTTPSRVNMSAANNIFDSTGADSQSFTVDIGDGDQAMGVSQPFYGSVYVFKGPNFGSVHQLSGNTAATFAIAKVAHGAPLLNPKALISTPSDIYWLSNYGIHSLETTVKFGNVEQAFLSLPIQRLWRENLLKRSDLEKAWGFWNPNRSIIGWAVTPQGSTDRLWLLVYNYALSDPKPGGKKFWSIWILPMGLSSGARIKIPTVYDSAHAGEPHLWIGGADGQAYVGDQNDDESDLNDAGAAYTYQIRTPQISRFPSPQNPVPETQEKQMLGVTTYFKPKATGSSVTLNVLVDNRLQTYTIDMSGGGAQLDLNFILDSTAILGGSEFQYVETPIEDRGRSISLEYIQSGANQDTEIYGYSVRFNAAEGIAMEQS